MALVLGQFEDGAAAEPGHAPDQGRLVRAVARGRGDDPVPRQGQGPRFDGGARAVQRAEDGAHRQVVVVRAALAQLAYGPAARLHRGGGQPERVEVLGRLNGLGGGGEFGEAFGGGIVAEELHAPR